MSFINAAAGSLPLITALGLLIGRRDHGGFVIKGCRRLFTLAWALAWAGLFYFPASYLSVVLPYGLKMSVLKSLLLPEGRPWLAAAICWLAGILALVWAGAALRRPAPKGDRYAFAAVRAAFCALALASLCFLASWLMENWPFAGLPESLGWDRAFPAISGHAMRRFFMSFCPAGALSLLLAARYSAQAKAPAAEMDGAMRWLAFWAAAGSIPSLFISWSLRAALWSASALPPGAPNAGAGLWALIFQTLACAFWVWIITRPGKMLWRAPLALLFIMLKEFWPLLSRSF